MTPALLISCVSCCGCICWNDWESGITRPRWCQTWCCEMLLWCKWRMSPCCYGLQCRTNIKSTFEETSNCIYIHSWRYQWRSRNIIPFLSPITRRVTHLPDNSFSLKVSYGDYCNNVESAFWRRRSDSRRWHAGSGVVQIGSWGGRPIIGHAGENVCQGKRVSSIGRSVSPACSLYLRAI